MAKESDLRPGNSGNKFRSLGGLVAQGVPIHFGEMGCYKHTPPEVVLAWFNDTLDVLGELNSGWALVEFPRSVWRARHGTRREQNSKTGKDTSWIVRYSRFCRKR